MLQCLHRCFKILLADPGQETREDTGRSSFARLWWKGIEKERKSERESSTELSAWERGNTDGVRSECEWTAVLTTPMCEPTHTNRAAPCAHQLLLHRSSAAHQRTKQWTTATLASSSSSHDSIELHSSKNRPRGGAGCPGNVHSCTWSPNAL